MADRTAPSPSVLVTAILLLWYLVVAQGGSYLLNRWGSGPTPFITDLSSVINPGTMGFFLLFCLASAFCLALVFQIPHRGSPHHRKRSQPISLEFVSFYLDGHWKTFWQNQVRPLTWEVSKAMGVYCGYQALSLLHPEMTLFWGTLGALILLLMYHSHSIITGGLFSFSICFLLLNPALKGLMNPFFYHFINNDNFIPVLTILTMLRYVSLVIAGSLILNFIGIGVNKSTKFRITPKHLGLFLLIISMGILIYQELKENITCNLTMMSRDFEVVAHRAVSPGALENTITSALGAKSAGAHRLEVDLQFTADGRIVLYHDPVLSQFTDYDLIINAASYENIRNILLPDGSKLPLLENFLSQTGETPLNLELKNYSPGGEEEYVEALLSILKTDAPNRDIVISSLDYHLLKKVKARTSYPTAMIGILGTGDLSQYETESVQLLDWGLKVSTVNRLHDMGKKVYSWSLGKSNNLEKTYLLGADGVISDNPGRDYLLLNRLSSLSRAELMKKKYDLLYF